MKNTLIVLAIVVAFLVGGFFGYLSVSRPAAEPTAPPELAERSTAEPTAAPTETTEPSPTPSATPEDTPTTEPSPTPRPSATPRPTSTPRPTATTAPMEPIRFSGSGDDLVDIDLDGDPAIIHIVGNAAAGHFAVQAFDAAGNMLDLLVNTTKPYDGVRPLDFLDPSDTTRIQVTAVGPWEIEVLSLFEMPRVNVPGAIKGTGDTVFVLLGPADIATITGNASSNHFAIHAYGGTVDLLVNTTAPYEGRVQLSSLARVIVVTATGDWSMEFTDR